jgi:DNA-binding CsgD family transcriptional regulator
MSMDKQNQPELIDMKWQQPQLELCEREAENIQEIEHFKQWTRQYVRPLIPHAALACVHGLIYGVGISLDYVVAVDYPVEHFAAIRNAAGHMDTPLARRWAEQKRPIFFDENNPGSDVSAAWLQHFRHSQLKNAAADGVMDTQACIATYFSFHRLPYLDEKVLSARFKLLTPILHQTYARVIRHHKNSTTSSLDYFSLLTTREYEIAIWISQGKSNIEIGCLLGVAENTVKNHISNILHKTGCNTRANLTVAVIQQEQRRFGIGTKVL